MTPRFNKTAQKVEDHILPKFTSRVTVLMRLSGYLVLIVVVVWFSKIWNMFRRCNALKTALR